MLHHMPGIRGVVNPLANVSTSVWVSMVHMKKKKKSRNKV